MPAVLASEVGVCVSMPLCSHNTNFHASDFVRTLRADLRHTRSYIRNMTRRGIPKKQPVWFLKEWMATCGFAGRGAQARMMDETGWSKATMSQLYNGQQDFNSEILRTAAQALKVHTWELLMPPEAAMAYRRQYDVAKQIVAVEPAAPEAETAPAEPKERMTGTR